MTDTSAKTIADLDPDRTVYVSDHYWNITRPKAHLHKDCHNAGDNPRAKTAKTLFDDIEICRACRGEHYGGVEPGENPRALRQHLIEAGSDD